MDCCKTRKNCRGRKKATRKTSKETTKTAKKGNLYAFAECQARGSARERTAWGVAPQWLVSDICWSKKFNREYLSFRIKESFNTSNVYLEFLLQYSSLTLKSVTVILFVKYAWLFKSIDLYTWCSCFEFAIVGGRFLAKMSNLSV